MALKISVPLGYANRRRFAGLGIGADIASAGELAAVTRAGFDMRKITHGPWQDGSRSSPLPSGPGCARSPSVTRGAGRAAQAGTARGSPPGAGAAARPAEEIADAGGDAHHRCWGRIKKFGLLREELDEAVDRLPSRVPWVSEGHPVCAAGDARLWCLERA